jgi:putative ABC transport system substrate-binding protein
VELVVVEASEPDQLETAFEAAHEKGAEGVHVFGDALTFRYSAEVVRFAAKYRMPAIYLFRQSVLDGGLISYGPNQTDFGRRAGDYIDKIIKDEKPVICQSNNPTNSTSSSTSRRQRRSRSRRLSWLWPTRVIE